MVDTDRHHAKNVHRQALKIEIEKHKGLVYFAARKFCLPGSRHWEDICQEGFIGLIKALNKYDKTRGKFSGFAMHYIRGEMTHYFRDKANAVRPRHYQVDILTLDEKLMQSAIQYNPDYLHELDRELTISHLLSLLPSDELRITFSLMLQGLDGRQIARKLDLHPSSIYRRIGKIYSILTKINPVF